MSNNQPSETNQANTLHQEKISVRNLVEFILRSGDLLSSQGGLADADAMQEGTRIHKKLQKQGGSSYRAEVPLAITCPVTVDDLELSITVEGRADGIFPDADGQLTIDEIKGIYKHPDRLDEPVPVHRAQALCYAYIYATQQGLDRIGVRLTYCYIPCDTEVRYFTELLTLAELEKWFLDLLREYAKWIAWQIKWRTNRDQTIKALGFPFPYRSGQHTLVKNVYQSILREKRLYIEAPTGVGKTVSAIWPTVKAMGEGLTERIFYLTAKTITRTVAEETFRILAGQGLRLKYITLTAKEKICILEDKPQCHPLTCPRAVGHFDRINAAIFDLLEHEDEISRTLVQAYAEKHRVCPFEFALDTSLWCDAIIGDYNYAFDPDACLKRFFGTETKKNYVFLIDEAHNLVDRAREMYSGRLIKEELLTARRLLPKQEKKLSRALNGCNKAMLELKKTSEKRRSYEPSEIQALILKALRLSSVLEDFLMGRSEGDAPVPIDRQEYASITSESTDKLLELYFGLRTFLSVYEQLDDHYIIYSEQNERGVFTLHLQCMDPCMRLDEYLKKGRCAVFYSATLLPIRYFREQLAFRPEDYAIYAPSPFSPDRRRILISQDVSTRYTLRGPATYQRIADYIDRFVAAKPGNYLVFFPSYKMLDDVEPYLTGLWETKSIESKDVETKDFETENFKTKGYETTNFKTENFKAKGYENIDFKTKDFETQSFKPQIIRQTPAMTEDGREEFLSHFKAEPEQTTLGLCVLGGIFSEGIDLKGSRLIGAVIVGTGLPMVCDENELFREYFDKKKGTGFDYAYRYPGMNKVLQAAGRVIRTQTDCGAILLLDNRFLQGDYRQLFPKEWFPFQTVTVQTIEGCLRDFWAAME